MLASRMMMMSLPFFFIELDLVSSAPSPMKKLFGFKGKGKSQAAESTSGGGDGSPEHYGSTARLHTDPGAGMAASTLYRDQHNSLVGESKQDILDYGRKYRASLVAARKILQEGYKPDRNPAAISGGPLRPSRVKDLTTPYSTLVHKASDHASHLDGRARQLDYPIRIYHAGGRSDQAVQLQSHERDLMELKEKWQNPPHTHPSIQNLPIVVEDGHLKNQALEHLDNQARDIEAILAKHQGSRR